MPSQSSDSVFSRPLSRRCFVSRAVGLVDVCDLRHERVVRVRVCEHRADREEDCNAVALVNQISATHQLRPYRTFGNGERGAPLIPQYVQADAAVAVDVWVVDAGGEVDFRWLEGVVCWEVDREEEDTAGVW